MHTKSDNVKIMNGTDTSDAIIELIKSFTKRYQEGLETKMKGSSYIFERVELLEHHLHKISLNRGSSYIDSPEWIKHKKITINPQNTKDNTSGADPERIFEFNKFQCQKMSADGENF